MKRLLTVFVTLSVVVVMTSCSPYRSSPKKLVERYIECLQAGEYDKIANLLYFEERKERAEKKEAMVTAFETRVEPRIKAKGGIASYTLNDVRVNSDGEKAYVELNIVYGDGSTITQDTEVLNKKGRWYLPSGLR